MHKNPGIESQQRKPVEPFEHVLPISDEGPSPDPPEDATAYSLLASTETCAAMQGMTREGLERSYTRQMQASITQVTEEVLSDIFQTGFESPKCGLKDSFYVFIKHILPEITHDKAPESFFN